MADRRSKDDRGDGADVLRLLQAHFVSPSGRFQDRLRACERAPAHGERQGIAAVRSFALSQAAEITLNLLTQSGINYFLEARTSNCTAHTTS